MKLKRGAVRVTESEFLGAWIPRRLVRRIDQLVKRNDTDRSKLIRGAIREKIERELVEATK